MKKIKIVTIGGGSSYTPELMEGFIKRASILPISELCLVDVESGFDKLSIVGGMAQRMVEAAGLDWKITLTTDRFNALKDADFVTTQFRVGGLDARIRDEKIPLTYGCLGQETNGAGGIFKAFRTIPVILDIVKEMHVQCPNAWLINFTNPAGMVTQAAINVGGWKKTLGLCNVPINLMLQDMETLGYKDFSNLTFQFAGLNHMVYHRTFENGVDVTDKLIDLIHNPENKTESVVQNITEHPYLFEQIKDTHLLPCPYHHYYYLTNEMLEEQLEQFKKGELRAQQVKKTEAELFELYADPNLDHKPEQLAKRGGAHYSDAACDVIASIYNNSLKPMVINTINNGAISDLADDAVVEVSCLMGANGPEVFNFGHFDYSVRGLIQQQKAMEEVAIEAAVSGDYAKALQSFILNPLVSKGQSTKAMLDEMLLANEEYLPQFKAVIADLKAKQ